MPPWLQVKQSALQLGYTCSHGDYFSQPSNHCLAEILFPLKFRERVAASAFLLSCGTEFDSCSCPFLLSLQQHCFSMPAML